MKDISVIGGGFAGLATAALLSHNGYGVTLFEKNNSLGGRARKLSEKGFTFDMGPSWYMMPEVFERFFSTLGYDVKDELDLNKLNPSYRIFFEGNHYDVYTDKERLYNLFESREKGSARRLDRYIKQAKINHNYVMKNLMYKDASSFLSYIDPRLVDIKVISQLSRSIKDEIYSNFNDRLLRKILMYPLGFIGSDASNLPALFSMMNYIDLVQGVYYPKGGMYELVKLLEKMVITNGGEILTQQEVESIDIRDGLIIGLITTSDKYETDLIVCAGDYKSFEEMLPEDKRMYSEEYWNTRDPAPTANVYYLGIKDKLKKFKHHTIILLDQGKDIYINIPSKSDRSLAPNDHHSVMVVMPADISQDFAKNDLKKQYSYIIKQVSNILGSDLDKKVVYKKVFTKKDFKFDYNTFDGNALGGIANNFSQSAIFRPKNKSSKISNLYFAGASTVPGIGVPPVFISATISANKIIRNDN